MATDSGVTDPATAQKQQLWCEILPKPDVNDEKAKKFVMEVLNKGAMARVNFFVPGLNVGFTPENFKQIKLRVHFDDIRVYERDGLAARAMDLFGLIDLPGDAAYFRDLDIIVTKASGADIYYQAIVVHECSHALLDMMGSFGSPLVVSTATSESAAYIAQAVFARACYEELGIMNKACPFEDSSDASMQQIFDTAWAISAKVLGGATRVTDADMATLVGLVPNTVTYRYKPANVNFNGIALRPASCE